MSETKNGKFTTIISEKNGTTAEEVVARLREMIQRGEISAGNIYWRNKTIEEVGARFFELLTKVANGKVLAKAEENKHREFQFWAEQTVSL